MIASVNWMSAPEPEPYSWFGYSLPAARPAWFRKFRGLWVEIGEWRELVKAACIVRPVRKITAALERPFVKQPFPIQQPRWSCLRWRSTT